MIHFRTPRMAYSPFRHLGSAFWKRSPIQLTLFLTRRCNARCPFCFYLSGSRGRRDEQPELTLEEMGRISASMGRLLWLAFSGGEIFLRNDLVPITELFYANNKPVIILLPTNGLLPEVIRANTERILKRCPQSTVVVKLSLDGPEALHDSLRGTPGAFKKVMETHRLLAGLVDRYGNFELGVNTVFCSANQDGMDEVFSLVNGLDRVKTHTVSLIRGDVADKSLKQVDMAKYDEAITKMERHLKSSRAGMYRFHGARLKAAQDILQRRLILETARLKRRLFPCHAGKLTLVVTETGDVYPCESFAGKIGNVREAGYDLKKMVSGEEGKKARRAIRRNGCFCTHECYSMMNILFSPRLYPALLKEYARVARRAGARGGALS